MSRDVSPPRPRALPDARRRRLCGFLVADTGHADSPGHDADVGSSTAQATTETSAAPTASGAAAICADAARFRASMTALTDLTLATVGVSGVTAALTEVQSAAQALAVSGHELVGQPVSDLLTSVQALQTTLTGLGDQPSLGAKLVAVKAAIEQIKTAASAVESALATTCPAS